MSDEIVYVKFDRDGDYLPAGQILASSIREKPDGWSEMLLSELRERHASEQGRTDLAWQVIRAKRNGLLQATDWRALVDSPLTNKEEWLLYRQALRDITNTPSPDLVVWPTPPST